MNRIRYEAIDDCERIIDGKMRDEESVKIHVTLSEKEKELTRSKIVDTTLNQLLWALEHEKPIELVTHQLHMTYKNDKRRISNILAFNYLTVKLIRPYL